MIKQKLGFHTTTTIAALCGSFLLAGCPDEPGGGETESTTEAESTDTTMTPTTVTVTVGMTSDSSSSSSTDPDTTVGVDDTSTGSSSSDTSSESSSSSGEPPPTDGYGDCANEPERVACGAGEICLDAGSAAACSFQDCQTADDCAAPTSGDAITSCLDLDKSGANDCYLDCSGGETCPDGMTCVFDFVCLWQLVAPGGGMCPDQDLGSTVPQAIMGDSTGLFDDHVASCGNGGGDDALYQFTAPTDGTYIFDTAGSSFDTVLAVLDSCGGPEIDCNDDSGKSLSSELTIDLVEGQSVILVVDSFDGEVGAFNLNVSMFMPIPPGACPDQDLGILTPQNIMGDNTGLGDNHLPSCSAGGGEDATYQFTALLPGDYRFDTTGSTFDTTLAVLDGCGGVELDCNDDTMVSATSEVTIGLGAGETVILVVDSYAGQVGPFNLNVTAL